MVDWLANFALIEVFPVKQNAISLGGVMVVALIFEVPVPTAVASPAAVIVATEVVAEAQVTWLVKS